MKKTSDIEHYVLQSILTMMSSQKHWKKNFISEIWVFNFCDLEQHLISELLSFFIFWKKARHYSENIWIYLSSHLEEGMRYTFEQTNNWENFTLSLTQ